MAALSRNPATSEWSPCPHSIDPSAGVKLGSCPIRIPASSPTSVMNASLIHSFTRSRCSSNPHSEPDNAAQTFPFKSMRARAPAVLLQLCHSPGVPEPCNKYARPLFWHSEIFDRKVLQFLKYILMKEKKPFVCNKN